MNILRKPGRFILPVVSLLALAGLVSCETTIDSGNMMNIFFNTAKDVQESSEGLTPEEEYYLGRSIVANLFELYPLLDNPAATRYVNTLGQTLALASDKPSVFNGYHFIILDSDDINAFATPGGFILITRGMMECTSTEGMLAAVLAHEISHIQLDHGVNAIKKSRKNDALMEGLRAGAAEMTSAEWDGLVEFFASSVTDVVTTLVVSGYSRDQEKEADAAAADLLARVGYDAGDLIAMLEEMDERLDPSGHDFAATHPTPQDRIDIVGNTISDLEKPDVDNTPARDSRYFATLSSL